MDKALPTLKIRVELPEPETEIPLVINKGLHWPRICTALCLVLATGVLLIQGVLALLDPGPVDPTVQSSQVTPSQESRSAEIVVIDTAMLTTETAASEAPVISELASVAPAVEEHTRAAPQVAKELLAPSVAVSQPVSSTPLRDGETAILSSQVKRFVITNRVKNKEPVGTIDDIRLDANNMITLYAWSDTRGLKDEFLHYRWFHNDKQVAKVAIGVWSNQWRSYSRKFLNEKMRGNWRVELRTGKGELLARSSFSY